MMRFIRPLMSQKTHTTNVATFQTPTFGPIGLVSKNSVIYFQN